jgi:serine/threonine protein kinase
VKVYLKSSEEDLQVPAKLLTNLWNTIPPTKYACLMPYQMWMRSSAKGGKGPMSPVYLLRQYFAFNLYDRMLTRPFVNDIERLWLIFQLFKCLDICHEHGIVHGDIKPENIMCTTSNWLVLTDFSPFKPVMLPDDDTADFQYFFDAMNRNRCYIAPERFDKKDRYSKSMNTPNSPDIPKSGLASYGKKVSTARISDWETPKRHTTAMDVFSLGCVMAEVSSVAFIDNIILNSDDDDDCYYIIVDFNGWKSAL